MKRLIAAAGMLAALGLAIPALAVTEPTATAPAQCAGMTFDHTFTAGNAQVVTGTAERDLIVVGDANRVKGMGGADCIVAGKANSIDAGAGADVVVLNGTSNSVKAGAGNDKVYDLAGGSKLLGEGGNDLLNGVGNTVVDGGAGTDECHTNAAKGKQTNCESPVVVTLGKLLGL